MIDNGEFAYLAEPFFNIYSVKLQPGFFLKHDRESDLYILLKYLDADILIVDGVWLPLVPILDDFKCKKIILFRQFEEWWFHVTTKKYGDFDFDPTQYDCTLSIEPHFTRDGWHSINPIVVRNHDEVLDRSRARKELGADTNRKICVLAHNGFEGELEKIETELEVFRKKYQVIVTSNRREKSFFPLADYFNGIDMIIGGAGYNLFYESRFFNIKSHFFPQERKSENQAWRIKTNSNFTFKENGADQLVDIIKDL
jgi:hypothetical protein